MGVIDGIMLKGRQTIIYKELQKQVISQLHNKHMGVKKIRLVAHESIYWKGINADTETNIKTGQHISYFKKYSWEIPGREWEVVSADMFSLYNKTYLCIVDLL